MKQSIIAVLLILPFLIVHSSGHAQSRPQFQLDLKYSDTLGLAGHDLKVAFGYDPTATNGVDAALGEAFYPPAPGSAMGLYVAFMLPDENFSQIDIMPRPKPVAGTVDSFRTSYTLWMSAYAYPATISWDRHQIPDSITAIVITPQGYPNIKLADMTKQDSVQVVITNPSSPNYYSNWWPATITVYYNTQPPPFLDVRSDPSPSGLITGIGTYPNPMGMSGHLAFSLGEAASVHIVAYDVAGRLVLNTEVAAQSGDNQLDLSGIGLAHGALLLHVDARSGSRHESRDLMILKD